MGKLDQIIEKTIPAMIISLLMKPIVSVMRIPRAMK